MPLLLAAKRARDLAVSVLPAPCGVLGTPNVGAAAGDANGLPGMPPDPGAKLKPPLGVGVAGAAVSDETVERTALDSNKTSNILALSKKKYLILREGKRVGKI